MLRRFARAALVAVVVPLTSLGVLVSTSGSAQALEWGKSDRLAVKLLVRGAQKGVEGGAPSIIARAAAKEAQCARSGPGTVGCMALTTAGIAIMTGAGLTVDKWGPWLLDQAGISSEPTTTTGGENWCFRVTLRDNPWNPTGAAGSAVYIPWQLYRVNTTSSNCQMYLTPSYDVVWTSSKGETNSQTLPASGGIGVNNDTAGTPWNVAIIAPNTGSGATWMLDRILIRAEGRNADPGVNGPGTWEWSRSSTTAKVSQKLQCTRPDGTSYEALSEVEPKFGNIGIPHCDAGDTPTSITSGPSGVPGSTLDLKPDPTHGMQYPQCVGTACLYRIFVDGNQCEEGVLNCVNWTEVNRVTPDRVQCRYGPYLVDTKLCYWLEGVYSTNPDRKIATKPNTDGDPRTGDETVTDTPTPSPSPSTSPTVSIPVDPAPPVDPQKPADGCLGGSAVCTPVTDPQTPTQSQNECWPSGFGVVNPANWVLQPVKCAWRWATVPRPEVITQIGTGIKTDIAASGPGPLVGVVGDIASDIGSRSDSCKGPEVSFNYKSMHASDYPLDACSGWRQTAAGLVKAFLSLVVVVGGGGYLVNSISRAFGYEQPIFTGGGVS